MSTTSSARIIAGLARDAGCSIAELHDCIVSLCRRLMAGDTEGFYEMRGLLHHPSAPGFWFFGNIGSGDWMQAVQDIDVEPMGESPYVLLHVEANVFEWKSKTKYGEGRCAYCGCSEFNGWECAWCRAV